MAKTSASLADANVPLADRHNMVYAGTLVTGGQGRAVLADLRDPEQCRALVQSAWETWGAIDIWINNAGADTLTGEAAR